MTFKPFSIVVVPFPFTDKEQYKRRPALVLSLEEHQENTSHITLAMITTAKNSVWDSDYKIKELKYTGLSIPSIIRQKIFTIDLSLIIKCIGRLSFKEQKQFLKLLRQHLGL